MNNHEIKMFNNAPCAHCGANVRFMGKNGRLLRTDEDLFISEDIEDPTEQDPTVPSPAPTQPNSPVPAPADWNKLPSPPTEQSESSPTPWDAVVQSSQQQPEPETTTKPWWNRPLLVLMRITIVFVLPISIVAGVIFLIRHC